MKDGTGALEEPLDRLWAAARLLSYPDDTLFEALPEVEAVVPRLAEPARSRYHQFLESLTRHDRRALAEEYVSTFDLSAETCLYLTYHSHRDDRTRGQALVDLQSVYARADWEIARAELPDYLPVILDFAACGPNDLAAPVARNFSPTVARLGRLLEQRGSPYAPILDSAAEALAAVGHRRS